MKQSDVKQTDIVCHCTALASDQAAKRICTLLVGCVCLAQGISPDRFQEESISLSSCGSEEELECSCLHIAAHSHFLFKVLH